MAIIGEKCVYLDKNDRYGGYLSCFNLEHFFRFVDANIDGSALQEGYRDFQVLKSYNLSVHKTEQDFKRLSRQFNIDLAPKLLFSKSTSVDLLVKSGASNYLEFQNVPKNFFSSEGTFVEIPFSKSEIFTSSSLSFKEKRQLVRVIGFCLSGYDLIAGKEITSAIINSTHAYEKLDTTLSKDDISLLVEYKDKPIASFLKILGIE